MRKRSFSEYNPAEGVEVETEPGSRGRVLRNRLHITRKRDMYQAEFEALLRVQEAYSHIITADTRFTSALLRQMHRDWLGEIYEWAGTYRTVEMSKGGFAWPPALRVESNMEALETGLLRRRTPCQPAPLPDVARRIAEVHAELLLIHPFRDGNGRLARWLGSLMAQQAGYPPPLMRFSGRDSKSERERYLYAVQQGYLQNYPALTDFFRETIERRLSSSD